MCAKLLYKVYLYLKESECPTKIENCISIFKQLYWVAFILRHHRKQLLTHSGDGIPSVHSALDYWSHIIILVFSQASTKDDICLYVC